jgi:ankyrin repeat protein
MDVGSVIRPDQYFTQHASNPSRYDRSRGRFSHGMLEGDLAEATRLLDAGAPIEGRDSTGRTGLFLACHGDSEVVKMLLARGAKIDATAFNGDTTIGRASEYGDLKSAQMLLAAGADATKANKYGHTPLMLAAREGHDDLVTLLIAQHVDVNADADGENAVTFATWKDHLAIVKMLFDAGAKVPSPAAGGGPSSHVPLLGLAAVTNDTPLIDLLLAHGGDISQTGKGGLTPLHMAVENATPATIAYILEKGADPEKQDDEGMTPLIVATLERKLDVMPVLIDHHANLEGKDKLGRTALIWACCRIENNEIRFLVDRGADLNAIDLRGETPLNYLANRCGNGATA